MESKIVLVIRPTVIGSGRCRGHYTNGRAIEGRYAAETGSLFKNCRLKVLNQATACFFDGVAGSCPISNCGSGGGGDRNGHRLTKKRLTI